VETYLDLMKGLNVENSDHLQSTYYKYEKLLSKLKGFSE
jgi:hypothetical protein